MGEIGERLFSASEVRKLTRCSIALLHYYRRTGILPAAGRQARKGSHFYRESVVREFLQRKGIDPDMALASLDAA